MTTKTGDWPTWLAALWRDPFERPSFARGTLPDLDAELGGTVLDAANALAYYTPRIAMAFLRAVPPVANHLSGAAFQAWINGGQALAPQHWELAVEYFRVAPRVVPALGDALPGWLRRCRRLGNVQTALGVMAIRQSPAFLASAGPKHLAAWCDGALRLATHTARGTQAAQAFLAGAAPVIARAPGALVDRWLTTIIALGNSAPGAAGRVLDREWSWFGDLNETTAESVLELAERFRGISAALAQEWWAIVAAAAPAMPPEAATGVVATAGRVAREAPTIAREFVAHGPGVFAQLPARHHGPLLQLTNDLAARHPQAALDLFTTVGALFDRLTPDEIREWFDDGFALLDRNAEAAIAYFRQESQASAERLRVLRQVVHFETVATVLQRYAEGLCGARLGLRATEDMPFEMRTLSADLPTTDGRTIYLPPAMERYGDRARNFLQYKLATAHQTGYFEFGTFRFDLGTFADHPEFDALFAAARARGPLRPALSDFERFFTLFAQPPLARDIFAACEDARVDQHLVDHYPGLRAPLAAAVADALAVRPGVEALPLRHAAVEWLVRLSLTRLRLDPAPGRLAPLDRPLRHLLGHVLHRGATVSDSALATVQLYTLLVHVPNLRAVPAEAVAELVARAPAEFAEAPTDGEEGALFFPDAAEDDLPYDRPKDLPFRGVLRPELVQKRAVVEVLQDALRDHTDEGQPLSAELLRQLLEMGVDINIKKLDLQQLLESSDLFITEMDNRPGLDDIQHDLEDLTLEERREIRDVIDGLAADVLDDPLEAERVFYYDEWSADISDYLHRWCRVKEVPVEPGAPEVVQRTVREHADLIRSVRQQFQMVKPEQLRKVRRLPDGEELDLNDAIAAVIDRRSRRTPDERIYQERRRQQRDVATMFLIDVSASTDEWIEDAAPEAATPEATPPVPAPVPRLQEFDDLRALWDPATAREGGDPEITVAREQRIIDMERAAVVVMAEALQGLGDEYAIYGFSGYGRENVDLFPVKTFAEPYGDKVRARLAGLEPHKSTRMGAAIRHANALLAEQPAKIKTLILLSDGYPQDMDYGKDRTSKAYGLHDTMVALQEARQAGILAFCLTIDQAGHDYLRHMCGGRDYLVIENVRALPRALPKVYRGLTA